MVNCVACKKLHSELADDFCCFRELPQLDEKRCYKLIKYQILLQMNRQIENILVTNDNPQKRQKDKVIQHADIKVRGLHVFLGQAY